MRQVDADVRALDAGDVAGATQVQVAMTTSDWDEASWLDRSETAAEDKGDAGLKSNTSTIISHYSSLKTHTKQTKR